MEKCTNDKHSKVNDEHSFDYCAGSSRKHSNCSNGSLFGCRDKCLNGYSNYSGCISNESSEGFLMENSGESSREKNYSEEKQSEHYKNHRKSSALSESGKYGKNIISLKYLEYPLPENIERLKAAGYFGKAVKLIDKLLNKLCEENNQFNEADIAKAEATANAVTDHEKLPMALKKRLELEKEIINRIAENYTVKKEEGLSFLLSNITDFTAEEFEDLWEDDIMDWIFKEGEVYLNNLYFDNLIKTRSDYRARYKAHKIKKEKDRADEDRGLSCAEYLGGKREEIEKTNEREKTAYIEASVGIEDIKDRKGIKVIEDINKDREWESPEEAGKRELLHNAIREMKENFAVGYRYRIRTELSIEADEITDSGKLQVYLPVPIVRDQVKNVRLISVTPTPLTVAYPEYPQRTVCFDEMIDQSFAEAGERRYAYSVEYEFDNVTEYKKIEPEKVFSEQPSFCTEENSPHIVFTPYLRALAKEIAGEEKNPYLKAEKIYDYITKNIRYSFVREYACIYNQAEYTAVNRKGDCGLQALLFITLCRILKIPAGWQSGLFIGNETIGPHDWAWFYAAPYGKIFVDCSFGGSAKRDNDEARRKFYGCNIDPFRIPCASEYQHEFIIPSEGLRNDPYDNQQGEAIFNGKALERKKINTVHRLLSIERIV